ncbi:MAG: imidazole glycerol phosphate synthase subunit HisH [Flavobacteriales bacterium]|nr:imidazole glycerol phosphate synthase subunit HisH [Flavobacteriales bacterium]
MIAIVKYKAGNVRSTVTDDPALLRAADKVIFPGVGEAGTAMTHLREKGLDEVLRNLKQPFLGICLGMQLMCSHSEEGDTDCLGIFPERVKRFPKGEKVPHMGWNELEGLRSHLMEGIASGSDVYFVHSYFAETGPDCIATTSYGIPFAAAMAQGNYFGVQFHPEKSGEVGRKILANFLKH